VSGYQGLATQYANQYGVPEPLFNDLIQAESGFNPNAYNSQSGATGLSQILASTAASPGYGVSPVTDRTDPNQSLNFAAQYLSALYNKFGNWSQAVLGFWQGPGYAQNNTVGPQGTPYDNSFAAGQQVNSDLQALQGQSSMSGSSPGSAPSSAQTPAQQAAAQSTPDQAASTSSSGCTGWTSTPSACITATLTELAYILLGLLVLVVGLWMLADREAHG
jgi:hypothetical protein